jgi:hypothetical protein
MKRRDILKGITLIPLGAVLSNPIACNPPGGKGKRSSTINLEDIDPGQYDNTWWNRTPIRLIQTNLPEIEGNMDTSLYVKSVMDASANALLFNTGGIVANYQTKLPFQWKNPYMGDRDLVAELIKDFHSKGVKYIARFDFSKLDATIAAKKPAWLYKGTNGKPQIFNGLYSACINGGYYQEYALKILQEVIENYPIDGIFFNMMGYTGADYAGHYTGICQCDNCKKRFHEETGLTLPVTSDDSSIQEYRKFQRRTADELYTKVTGYIKELNPKLIIYNYNAVGTQWIASESGSSMSPRVDNIYNATDKVKRTLGSYKDKTPLNLIMYFQAIGYRSIGSSANLLRTWWLENMLHGAPVSMVVVGTLVHYEDRAFIPIANELFRYHKQHEKLFTNVQANSKVAVVMGSRGEYTGIMQLLSEEHITYDVVLPAQIDADNCPRKLKEYQILILGDVRDMSDKQIKLIDEYIQNGGKALVTGATSTNDENGSDRHKIALQSLGVLPEYQLFNKTISTYLKVSEKDKEALGKNELEDFTLVMMYSDFLQCKTKDDAQGYLRLLPDTRFGPAEKTYYAESDITNYPGIVSSSYGQGKTVFIPWLIGEQYSQKGNYAQRILFIASLKNLLSLDNPVETDASPVIEITHLHNLNGAFEWIGMINHSGFLANSIREPITINNIRLRVQASKKVANVHLMRSKIEVDFKQTDGWIECTVPEIKDFEQVVLLYQS